MQNNVYFIMFIVRLLCSRSVNNDVRKVENFAHISIESSENIRKDHSNFIWK